MNMVAYLNQYRIVQAQRLLLTTNDSVAEIATACGFGSLSRFYAVFKQIRNLSPNRFRRTFSIPKPD